MQVVPHVVSLLFKFSFCYKGKINGACERSSFEVKQCLSEVISNGRAFSLAVISDSPCSWCENRVVSLRISRLKFPSELCVCVSCVFYIAKKNFAFSRLLPSLDGKCTCAEQSPQQFYCVGVWSRDP